MTAIRTDAKEAVLRRGQLRFACKRMQMVDQLFEQMPGALVADAGKAVLHHSG